LDQVGSKEFTIFLNWRQITARKTRQICLKVERQAFGKGTLTMKKERRWLKSVIAASLEPQAALTWQRGARRKPAAFKPVVVKPRAVAAR
jgi:hypothetical protein